MLPDLLENFQGLWVFHVDVVWGLAVVWPEVHVAIGMEIVNKLNAGLVLHDESAESSCFWLRKRCRAPVVLCTWISAATSGLVPTDSVVSVEIDSLVFVGAHFSVGDVHVLPLFREHSSRDEFVLNVGEAVDVHNWDHIVLILDQHVHVMLLSVDDATVKKLEDRVKGHLDGY